MGTSPKEQLKQKNKRSVQQEIQHDQEMVEKMLKRPERAKKNLTEYSAEKKYGENDVVLEDPEYDKLKKEYELEEKTAGVLKRILYTAALMDIEITDVHGKKVKASENGLPVASYLMHGQRIAIELPEGSDHAVANYIFHGIDVKSPTVAKDIHPESPALRDVSNLSTTTDPETAKSENKVIYKRLAATHYTKVVDGKIVEKKGLGDLGCHYGMNIGAGEYGTTPRDGLHGHLYIYYKPATKNKPGCLMFGMEASAPPTPGQVITRKVPKSEYGDKHGVDGGADEYTCIGSRPGGSKINPKTKEIELGQLDERLEKEKQVCEKHKVDHPLKDVKIPRRYDGTRVSITQGNLSGLLVNTDDIPNTVGNFIPGTMKVSEEGKNVVTTYQAPDDVYQDLYSGLDEEKKKKAFNVECNTLSNNEAIAKQTKVRDDLQEKVDSRVPSTPSKVRVGGAAAAGFIFGLIVGGPIAAFALAAAAVLISYAPQIKEAISNKLEDRKLAKAEKKLEKLEDEALELQGKRKDLELDKKPEKRNGNDLDLSEDLTRDLDNIKNSNKHVKQGKNSTNSHLPKKGNSNGDVMQRGGDSKKRIYKSTLERSYSEERINWDDSKSN